MFLAASAQGNVGLTIIAPDKWLAMASGPKTVLMLLMWAGRIEIFPVLTLIRALIPRKE
jgi:Trk-type K+ transport system membrane component